VTKADFACPLLKEQALQEILNIADGASAVEVKSKKEPETVSRLAVNEYRAQLSTTDRCHATVSHPHEWCELVWRGGRGQRRVLRGRFGRFPRLVRDYPQRRVRQRRH